LAAAGSMNLDQSLNRGHSLLMIELSEQQIIDELAGRLVDVYAEVEPERIARIVHDAYVRFDGRPIRDFVPLFVERSAKLELSRRGV
jgi:hypothetical protein